MEKFFNDETLVVLGRIVLWRRQMQRGYLGPSDMMDGRGLVYSGAA